MNRGSSAVLPIPFFSFLSQFLTSGCFVAGGWRRMKDCTTHTILKTPLGCRSWHQKPPPDPTSPKEKKKQPNHQIRWKISINKYENTRQKATRRRCPSETLSIFASSFPCSHHSNPKSPPPTTTSPTKHKHTSNPPKRSNINGFPPSLTLV